MKLPDLSIEKGEEEVSLTDFIKFYNKGLPLGYPNASTRYLLEFKESHPKLFINNDMWSLIKHRKNLMDWLQRKTKSSR